MCAKTPCGVSQSSMLGSLPFLIYIYIRGYIYINDIPNSSSKLSFYLFADKHAVNNEVNELKNVFDWLTAKMAKTLKN